MKQLKPESAKTLAWAAGILMVLALVILSPSAGFVLLVLAAICAAIALAFGPKRQRVLFIALLAAAVALAVNFYPKFERERQAYAERAKQRGAAQTQTRPAVGPRE